MTPSSTCVERSAASLELNNLKVAHLVGLHAQQALPLLPGRCNARAAGSASSPRSGSSASPQWAAAGLVALLAWQAERGLPLLRAGGTVAGVARVRALLRGTTTPS